MPIALDDFKLLMDSLEKSANRTRSIYYVFAIIYVSITLYAVNAFIFLIPQERLKQFRTYIVECQKEAISTPHCLNLATFLPDKLSPKDDTGFAQEFDRAGAKHRQDTYLDEIATSRKFTFPLFGVSVDEDYFWLMNSIIGLIIYFVLISALANEAELFVFMVDAAGNDKMRLRIVLSTQVLSSPSDHEDRHTSRRIFALKTIMLRSVLLLPIATGVLWILYGAHVFDVVKAHFSLESIKLAWGSLVDDFETDPILSAVSLIVQAASVLIMARGFAKILDIVSGVQEKYKAGATRLKAADALPGPMISIAE